MTPHPGHRGSAAALPLLAASALLLAACGGASSPAEPTPTATWAEGAAHGRWEVVFTGHGDVGGDDAAVTMAPTVAANRDVTHGALVVDGSPFTDARITGTVRTDRQLREDGTPNPWEVGWVLFRYQDPDHFYAVVLKPNGWELSKQDPAYPGKQRFLDSGTSPTFAVGTPHHLEITVAGPRITVSADGTLLTEFTDHERPYGEGRVALYTEDAAVTFTDVTIDTAI